MQLASQSVDTSAGKKLSFTNSERIVLLSAALTFLSGMIVPFLARTELSITVRTIFFILALTAGLIAVIVLCVGYNRKPKTDFQCDGAKWLMHTLPRNIDIEDIIGKGRQRQAQKIFQDVASESARGRSYAILGPTGIGKRMLCSYLAHEVQTNCDNYTYIGYFDCVEGVLPYQKLASELTTLKKKKHQKPNDVDSFLRGLGKTMLILTGITCEEQLNDIYRLKRHANLAIIIAASFNSISWVSRSYYVEKLSETDSKRLYLKTMGQLKNSSQRVKLDSRDALLYACTDGIPLLIQAVAEIAMRIGSTKLCRRLEGKRLLEVNNDFYKEWEENGSARYSKSLSQYLRITYDLPMQDEINLEKLAMFAPKLKYTPQFALWFGMDYGVLRDLRNKYWLKDGDFDDEFIMDEFHLSVFQTLKGETLDSTNYLEQLMVASTIYFTDFDNLCKHFRNFFPYAERIKSSLQNDYTRKSKPFQQFALLMIKGYDLVVYQSERPIEWFDLFVPEDPELKYEYNFSLLRHGYKTDKEAELEALYNNAVESLIDAYGRRSETARVNRRTTDLQYANYMRKVNWIKSESIFNQIMNDSEATFFDKIDAQRCFLYHSYFVDEDKNAFERIVRSLPKAFWEQYDRKTMWLCAELYRGYRLFNGPEDKEAKFYLEKGTIIGNVVTHFCSPEMQEYFEIKDERMFAEYMHSKTSLYENLQLCLRNDDPEAHYIEGRYLESVGEIDKALKEYRFAKSQDSARASCAMGYLYLHGSKDIEENLDKAEKHLVFGCERLHAGSHYFLAQLYKKRALQCKEQGKTKEYRAHHEQYRRYLEEARSLGSSKANSEPDECEKP